MALILATLAAQDLVEDRRLGWQVARDVVGGYRG